MDDERATEETRGAGDEDFFPSSVPNAARLKGRE